MIYLSTTPSAQGSSLCFFLSTNKLISAHTHTQCGFSLLQCSSSSFVKTCFVFLRASTLGRTFIAAISEDRLQKSVFPHASKDLFLSSFFSVLIEKSHHHPRIKFTWIKRGRGRMKGVSFPPFSVIKPILMVKEFLLTVLFVIGIYLLRKVLGWRELEEVFWSTHKSDINLSTSISDVRRALLFLNLSDFLLLCTSGRKEMNFCFLFCWVLAAAANVWYSFLATDIKNIAHWVYLELSF